MPDPTVAELRAMLVRMQPIGTPSPPAPAVSVDELRGRVALLKSELALAMSAASRSPRPTSALEVLGIREATFTRFYAWVLNPLETHGFGTDLLRFVLSIASRRMTAAPQRVVLARMMAHPLLEAAAVAVEEPLPGGQVDLIVRVGLDRLLIEVKYGAPETGRQLEVYADEVARHPGRAALVVLAPKNHPDVTVGQFKDTPMIPHGVLLRRVRRWTSRLDAAHPTVGTLNTFSEALLRATKGDI